ncbi:hypothetical protein [Enterobacter asburiae]
MRQLVVYSAALTFVVAL